MVELERLGPLVGGSQPGTAESVAGIAAGFAGEHKGRVHQLVEGHRELGHRELGLPLEADRRGSMAEHFPVGDRMGLERQPGEEHTGPGVDHSWEEGHSWRLAVPLAYRQSDPEEEELSQVWGQLEQRLEEERPVHICWPMHRGVVEQIQNQGYQHEEEGRQSSEEEEQTQGKPEGRIRSVVERQTGPGLEEEKRSLPLQLEEMQLSEEA